MSRDHSEVPSGHQEAVEGTGEAGVVELAGRTDRMNAAFWREAAELDREYLQGYLAIHLDGPITYIAHQRVEELQETFDGSYRDLRDKYDGRNTWDEGYLRNRVGSGSMSRPHVPEANHTLEDAQKENPDITRDELEEIVKGFYQQQIDQWTEDDRVRAEAADARAERLEDWAGVLYRNPEGAAQGYERRHHLTPKDCVELENEVVVERAFGDQMEAAASQVREKPLNQGAFWEEVQRLEQEYHPYAIRHLKEVREAQEKIQELVGNDRATVGELKGAYAQVLERGAEVLQGAADSTATFLEGLRKGTPPSESTERPKAA